MTVGGVSEYADSGCFKGWAGYDKMEVSIHKVLHDVLMQVTVKS